MTQSEAPSNKCPNNGLIHEGKPLVVDLDGTLIQTDMLHELTIALLRNQPHYFFILPSWLIKGKAYLKEKIATHTNFDPEFLPFNLELINWLKQQKSIGRKLILCTATDISVAQIIANHTNLFDQVIASDGKTNLAGAHKAQILKNLFGEKGFDYVGNSHVDLAVWKKSCHGIVVSNSNSLISKAATVTKIERIIPSIKNTIKTWGKFFRWHQWIKNTLLFVPIFAANHSITQEVATNIFLSFFSFCICASSIYIVNDLLDLENDRKHPRKCLRPLPSGSIPIWQGLLLAPLLALISLILGYFVNNIYLMWLIAYLGLTSAYSWRLKRIALIDCLTLAILYTLRIVAGAAAVNISLSFWLLAFSTFLFLSLAFIKRYSELQIIINQSIKKTYGRDYYTSDSPLIQQLGITSGYLAILVLALYLNNENVIRLYSTPEIMWSTIPLMLLWISRMWLKANRGLMHDDPIVFAIKDRVSLLIGALLIAIFTAARVL